MEQWNVYDNVLISPACTKALVIPGQPRTQCPHLVPDALSHDSDYHDSESDCQDSASRRRMPPSHVDFHRQILQLFVPKMVGVDVEQRDCRYLETEVYHSAV